MKINTEDILLYKLCCDISKYDKFVIYGAGIIAETLLKNLKREKYLPLYCVVTDTENKKTRFDNLSVYSIEEKKTELKESNFLILVATSQIYEDEIVSLLEGYQINNIIRTSHYYKGILTEKIFKDIYEKKDYVWFQSKIKEWCWDKNGSIPDEEFICNKSKGKDRIIFVVELLSARVVKTANALQQLGKEVIVLINRNRIEQEWDKFGSSLNVEYEFYGPIEELFFLLKKHNGTIVHVYVDNCSLHVAYMLIKFQHYIGKVIFETYDIISGFYTCVSDYAIELEKYCLENAYAICYREYSLEYQTDILNYDIKGKSLRFYDYCKGESINFIPKRENEELSLCYVGTIATQKNSPFAIHMELADKCEEHKCHLHIYPYLWDEKLYENYIKRDKESAYFHFHKTIPYNDLVKELAQYDYGILGVSDNIWERECSGHNTKYKYIYLSANKIFDYMDAGLAIISPLPPMLMRELEEMKVALNWTLGQYDFDYLQKMKTIMKENILKVREKFKIDNNINMLIDFYESL